MEIAIITWYLEIGDSGASKTFKNITATIAAVNIIELISFLIQIL
jgi:hypothetical protein